ncbi:acyl-CoA dehydrogenase family protein [Xenorhabdus doucetiae]|uniref:Alkylation response protein AidB-like acyl-CoA dehydrogenase n=1 Tax=Xenorhabdus doucetiae TaxID=351671 RepID=A0A068QRK4_9GAMM|nr:acyl-CoA dehydrogenase family protein [Xenorhabdus doucetiae]TYP16621.1 alkylation response protein AidB-like acyl-CoA dehydrogenase [Xenorhabdus doucetiae]CDG16470.1 Long-chain specific acyl-CoA dehydrogenase, mitochondrial [Xenorhabdus doucetiae]
MRIEIDSFDHYRKSCREFLAREIVPEHPKWEENGLVERSFWEKLGQAGLLGMAVSPEFGGRGKNDYRFAVILTEELIKAGVTVPGIVAHNDVVTSYLFSLANGEQKNRWLPELCSGKRVAAIAMTEPGGGSNTADIKTVAKRQGDYYRVNGSKTYITNGINADLIVVAVKTDEGKQGQGISLLAIERDMPGFTRGAPLKKIGWHGSDTAELFFDDCKVPVTNLIGRENLGNYYFMSAMPRERLSISTVAVASAEQILQSTLDYVKERAAFNQPIGSFQYNRFMLAQLDTEVNIARIYLDNAVDRFNQGLFTLVDAARIKLWTTELQMKVADRCLQLHGGLGYLRDSIAGKNWLNSRAQTIYGGTSEVLQEIISKSMGL